MRLTDGSRGLKRGGFTYVELMVSLAILAVLAAVSLPLAQLHQQRQKEHELRMALALIRLALDEYKAASDQGRIARKPGASGYPDGLDALVQGADDQRSPDRRKLYFLRRIPRDPFHPDLSVPASETWRLRSYASPPDRPSPGDDVFDVFSSSDRIGLNGVPYRDW